MGRFLQTDPIGYADQINLYAYVYNDPLNHTDPTGMCGINDEKCWEWVKSQPDKSDPANNPYIAMVDEAQDDVGRIAAYVPGLMDISEVAVSAREGDYQGVALAALPGPLGRLFKQTCCFVAGTLVDTEEGLRPIEEIEIGDQVWARDEETGETALKAVTDMIRRHERVIWEVSLSGENGAGAFFETTDDHPWWILGKDGSGRWVMTEGLVPGMAVVSRDADGPDGRMVIASVTETARTDATYNLTVADFETYFVGEQRLLVHNCTVGRRGEAHTADGNNVQTEIGDRVYTGHALDRMQESGMTPSVIEDTIANGRAIAGVGDRAGTTKYATEQAMVVIDDASGRVITADPLQGRR